jgi:hypothetical protein
MITCTLKIKELKDGSLALWVEPVIPEDHTALERAAATVFRGKINEACRIVIGSSAEACVDVEGADALSWSRKIFG